MDIAVRQLEESGLDGGSVAGIARELGIAHNAIRWYFPTRDELVVAAMRVLLQRVIAKKPPPSQGPRQKVVWFAEQLHRYASLRSALYERARSSTVVATFMEEFQELLRGMVAIWLTGDRSRRSIKIEAFLASLDGAVLIADPRERAAVVRCAYDAFSERQS